MSLTPEQFAELVAGAVEEALTPVVARLVTVERDLAVARAQLTRLPTKAIDGRPGAMGRPGLPGRPGLAGSPGQRGLPGPAGADGSSFVSGVGPPRARGAEGDVYLDARTGDVYLCR